MRYLFGSLSSVALGMLLLVGCSEGSSNETDTPSYCNETSFDLWYGPSLDCELEQEENFCYPEDGG